MASFAERAPRLGAATLALTAILAAIGLGLGIEAPGAVLAASVVFAAATLVCGLAARGRGATLALVVPSLVYLSYALGIV